MEFVDFNLAEKLKEKGFRLGCIRYYNSNNELQWSSSPWLELDYNGTGNMLSAPTISKVLKWLREEKGLHICISCCIDPLSEWNYEIAEIDGVIFKHADDGYGSYEEAAKAGISYVLDNLI